MDPKCHCEDIFLLEPFIFSRKKSFSPARTGGSSTCDILGKMTMGPRVSHLSTSASSFQPVPHLVLLGLYSLNTVKFLKRVNKSLLQGTADFNRKESCQGLIICIHTFSQFPVNNHMFLSFSKLPPGFYSCFLLL